MRRFVVLTLLSSCLLLSTAGAASSRTYLPGCVGGFHYKPRGIVVYCADAGVELLHMRWTAWRRSEAKGYTVRGYANDCDPSCADGTFRRIRARVYLYRVRSCRGRRTFTRMRIRIVRGRYTGRRLFTQDRTCF